MCVEAVDLADGVCLLPKECDGCFGMSVWAFATLEWWVCGRMRGDGDVEFHSERGPDVRPVPPHPG